MGKEGTSPMSTRECRMFDGYACFQQNHDLFQLGAVCVDDGVTYPVVPTLFVVVLYKIINSKVILKGGDSTTSKRVTNWQMDKVSISSC